MKVCLVGGAGGHLRELFLIAQILEEHSIDFFYVTLDTDFTRKLENAYLVPYVGSNYPELLVRNILNLLVAVRVIKKENPDVVITSGTEFAIPYCLFCKIRKKSKTIFVESLCRMEGPSGTGRIIGPFVDYYFVQWERALQNAPRKARFWGRVL